MIFRLSLGRAGAAGCFWRGAVLMGLMAEPAFYRANWRQH
jgi:hypothetical protein